MGTRTWSRKGVLTAAGRRRQQAQSGANAAIINIWGDVVGDDEDTTNLAPPAPASVAPATPPTAPTPLPVTAGTPRRRRTPTAPAVVPPTPVPPAIPAPTPVITVSGNNPQALQAAVQKLSAIPLDRTLDYEQLILVDGNNNEIARVNGDKNSASEDTIPQRVRTAAQYLIHNHPSPVPFSPADLANVIGNGRRGIEARGKPMRAAERTLLNTQFTTMRTAFEKALNAIPAKSHNAVYMRDMISVIDEWMAHPDARSWKFMAINDNPRPDFRFATKVDATVKKHTKEMVQLISFNPDVRSAVRAFGTDRKQRAMFNTAMTILVQSVANTNALRGSSYTIGTFFE